MIDAVQVPERAHAVARHACRANALRGAGGFVIARQAVIAAAPLIVASELRRLANGWARHLVDQEHAPGEGPFGQAGDLLAAMCRHADELDGGE